MVETLGSPTHHCTCVDHTVKEQNNSAWVCGGYLQKEVGYFPPPSYYKRKLRTQGYPRMVVGLGSFCSFLHAVQFFHYLLMLHSML